MDEKVYHSLSRPRMELSYSSSSEEDEETNLRHKHYRESRSHSHTHTDYQPDRRFTYNSHKVRRKTHELLHTDLNKTDFPDFQTELHSANQELAYPGSESLGVASDPESVCGASPDHALRLWMQEVKSDKSSRVSSRANSLLSLTDTEQEGRGEQDNDNDLPSSPVGHFSFRPLPPPPPPPPPPHACLCSPSSGAPEPTQRNTLPTRNHQSDNKVQQDKTHNTWALNSNIPLETRKPPPRCVSTDPPAFHPDPC